MTPEPVYVIDSDVFISAKNGYYAFVICPGFWDSLIHHHRNGRVHSLDRIQQELLAGRKDEVSSRLRLRRLLELRGHPGRGASAKRANAEALARGDSGITVGPRKSS